MIRSLFGNKKLRLFFLRLIVLILLWECGYHLFLQPARVPDKVLTNTVAVATAKGIDVISQSSRVTYNETIGKYSGVSILRNGKLILFIADACNGLDLIAIYLLLIILLPYSVKRKLIFGIGGIIGIIIANIIRCISLYWIYFHCPSAYEFNHHYVFSILMYIIIFSGWILFTKTNPQREVN